MYTDLFSALLNRENHRGHPILSAMLYSFCPAAARWWIAGADPQPPFDPIWQAIKDWEPEISLAQRLTQYGLGNVLDVVKKYVGAVDKYRFQHRNVLAPELLPFFSGGEFPLNRRIGSENGIQNLGGDWKNLFIYARTWAFLLEDWRSGILADQGTDYSRKVETVLLTLPDYRQPANFEAVIWRVRTGHVAEARIGALVQDGDQDLLRLALLGLSNPQGDHPWPNLPLVYTMKTETGEAKLVDRSISSKELSALVRQLAKAAQEGPYPPLTALQRPSVCKCCGYQNLCYHNSNLAPHLLSER